MLSINTDNIIKAKEIYIKALPIFVIILAVQGLVMLYPVGEALYKEGTLGEMLFIVYIIITVTYIGLVIQGLAGILLIHLLYEKNNNKCLGIIKDKITRDRVIKAIIFGFILFMLSPGLLVVAIYKSWVMITFIIITIIMFNSVYLIEKSQKNIRGQN